MKMAYFRPFFLPEYTTRTMLSAVENTKIMSIEGIIPIFDVVLTFRGATGRELHGDFFQGLLPHGRQQSK